MQILTVGALILIGILFFVLIVFIHEFGHFITAKKSGVKVNEFSIGMGPKLFGFKKGETQYSFRLLPIGGYCAMEGEDEDSDEPRAFNNAKIWKRMIIIIAGAVMNIILGFVLMFAYTVQMDSYATTTVNQFYPNSYSANCGLEAGDKIVRLNDYSIWNSRDLQFAMATMTCKDVDGKSLKVYKQDCALGAYYFYADIIQENKNLDDNTAKALFEAVENGCTKINKANTKDEAYKLMSDTCRSLNNIAYDGKKSDVKIPEIEEKETRQRYTTDITVIRNGKEVVLNDVQFYTYYASEDDKEAGKTSVAIDYTVTSVDRTLTTVISEAFSETCSMAKMVWTSLVWMVQGRFSFTELSGPVGIATAVTQVASEGLKINFMSAFNNIMFVMILITVNLGVVNMLPFPALDGGRFLFLLIEGIFKKPIPRKVEQVVNGAGLALLLLFTLIITIKDIWQLSTGNFPGM